MESQYRALLMKEERFPALALMATTLVIWVIFVGLDIGRLDIIAQFPDLAPEVWLLVFARWTTLAMLAGYFFVLRRSQRVLPSVSLACYLAVGATLAISVMVMQAHQQPVIEILQVVVVMAAFLPMGLSFGQAVVAAVVVACAATAPHLIGAGASLVRDPDLPLSAFVSVAIGALGRYLLEYSHRQQFLLRAILRRQALFDPMTGLANRRLFEHHGARLLAQSARDQESVTFAVIDIDFFKQYNDLYGHGAGDEALRRVAHCLQTWARRPLDLAVRLGGEEFGLLLHDADEAECSRILSGFHAAVAALGVEHGRSQVSGNLTVSIGAARFDGVQTLDELRERADSLLYISKNLGRNRLTVSWGAGNENSAETWKVAGSPAARARGR